MIARAYPMHLPAWFGYRFHRHPCARAGEVESLNTGRTYRIPPVQEDQCNS